MKLSATALVAALALLGGCATTIPADVTAFNAWPAAGLPDKSYVFVAPPPTQDTLEYRNYQNLVRAELAKLGFTEAPGRDAAKLQVTMQYMTVDRPEQVIESDDPFWNGYGPYYRPWGYRRLYGPYYGAYGPTEWRSTLRHNYERQLRIAIDGTDGKKLFDVTVSNTSRKAATASVMPALVSSAFAGFPGQNGVPHRVEYQPPKQG